MNQSLKFTPGPWHVQHPIGIGSIQVTATRKAYPIALVFTRPYIQEEDLANAQLMAAAPELLEAAIALFNDASDRDEVIDHYNVGDGEVMYADWAALKKAIDKATGATA